ncbi:MAG: PadR family transcriptional regulator [Christensenellales bacterium]|jgi:PadR family transcriptional regulator PadR
MDAQMKKGILDACVLAELRGRDGYGYSILKSLSGVVNISESTLYPILRRLEQSHCLTTYTMECDGRLRKYYRITEAGRRKLNDFLVEWQELAAVYNFIRDKTRY